MEIDLNFSESRVTMHACSRCDTRWWDRDGQVIELGRVLALVPSRR